MSCRISAFLLLWMGRNAIPVDGQDFDLEDLSNLTCASYENVLLARNACNEGEEFLMWGEYLDSKSNNTKKSLFEIGNASIFDRTSVDGASYGPYYCSGCSGNLTTDYGFVRENASFTTANCSAQPDVKALTRDDLSCHALQRHCEESKVGWLTYAKTFESATGTFKCSGCEEEDLYVYHSISSLPEYDTNFASWPMLIMWGCIVFFLVLASILDYGLFIGDTCEWLVRYILHQFGYVNLKGEKQNCRSVCKNPCECLCFCCRCGENSYGLWFRFLSLTFLSLGVSILFGDGDKHEHVCFFKASPMEATSNYSDILNNAMRVNSYGQRDGPGFEDSRPETEFNTEWIISEIAILLYSTSQEMLIYNLVRKELMTEVASSILMLFCSCIFTLCCTIFYWDYIKFENILYPWLFLLFVSSILSFIIGGLAYVFASLMVCCFRCKIPESDETRRIRRDQKNPTRQEA